MKNKLLLLAGIMDKRKTVRMAVLFFPGIIFGKLLSQIEAPQLYQNLTQILLLAGVAVYLAWDWIKRKLTDDSAESDEPTDGAPTLADAKSPKRTLGDLVTLCGGDEPSAKSLVIQEMQVDPELTYAQALDRAIRRKTITS